MSYSNSLIPKHQQPLFEQCSRACSAAMCHSSAASTTSHGQHKSSLTAVTHICDCYCNWRFTSCRYHRPVARELQRLDALTRSPIYAHFGETLGGLTAIRAFGHMNRFARVNERMIDNNLRAYLAKKVSHTHAINTVLICTVLLVVLVIRVVVAVLSVLLKYCCA
jgi:ABC-type multidrug transport system fused ATPase/permease subunit